MRVTRHHSLSILIAGLVLSAGCRTVAPQPSPAPEGPEAAATIPCQGHHNLDSTLWAETSAEYRALALQAYNTATAMLDRALADPRWTAAVEQEGRYESLPPAVVLDVDDTVLNHWGYQARLIRSGASFNAASWSRWVADRKAEAMPGAVAFTRYAAEKGVEVFFVTNHTMEDEPDARRLLEQYGFPLDARLDTFLAVGEQSSSRSSDKTERRRWIASRYRILLAIGDALGDFVAEPPLPPAERRLVSDRYQQWWGTRWFMIPNPMYGAWERAILRNPTPLDPQQQIQRKMDTLGNP